MKPNTPFITLACVLMAGCVPAAKYEHAVAEAEITRAELTRKNVALFEANAELDARRLEITTLESQFDALTRSSRVAGAGKEALIADLKKRLDELKAAQAAAEARATTFRELAKKLERAIDAGDLSIVLRDQRMVLQMPNEILFDTGKADLKPAGKTTLASVAAALQTLPNRHFQVAGHTDNVPIKTARFASNWELSSARGLDVVHFLLAQGVPPEALSAAGYADVDPVATNETPEGRKQNRRTEITIQPNIDEIVHVP